MLAQIAASREDASGAEPTADVALTVEALIKSVTPPAPAPVAPAKATAAAAPRKQPVLDDTAKPAASGLPQEFKGLKFPNDGVLTRQWMEFLSQMSTTK